VTGLRNLIGVYLVQLWGFSLRAVTGSGNQPFQKPCSIDVGNTFGINGCFELFARCRIR
jgi:hypothetical protein